MTIYDIASEAGVSISTVSRVLNNPEKVKDSTYKKVEAVLTKYNYSPNAMARGLVYNSMKTIGMCSSDFRHLHFSVTASVIERLFFNWGYSSMLCNTGYQLEKQIRYIRILAEKKVDGVVLIGSPFNEIGKQIHDFLPDTPIVMANGTLSIPNAYSVMIDHRHGMNLAVTHLKERGRRDILLVITRPTYNIRLKTQSFFKAMEENELPADNSSLFETVYGLQGGSDVIDQILDSKCKFNAITFTDDLTALGAIKRLKQRGLRVPEDVAVVGYDNSSFSQCADPGLTTVDTRNETFSTIVANTLHDLLLQKAVGTSITVRPELVVREST